METADLLSSAGAPSHLALFARHVDALGWDAKLTPQDVPQNMPPWCPDALSALQETVVELTDRVAEQQAEIDEHGNASGELEEVEEAKKELEEELEEAKKEHEEAKKEHELALKVAEEDRVQLHREVIKIEARVEARDRRIARKSDLCRALRDALRDAIDLAEDLGVAFDTVEAFRAKVAPLLVAEVELTVVGSGGEP